MVIPIRDDNPTRTKPVVTIAIIIACLAIFAFVQPHSRPQDQLWTFEHAAIPCEVVHQHPITPDLNERCDGQFPFSRRAPGQTAPFPAKNVLLAVVVSMFLHGSWLHVLGNMLFLWIFGNNVEERLGPIGYSVFYLVSGVVAAVAHIATQPDSTVPVVGASGAVAGVMGFYLVLYPKARVLTIIPLFIFWQFVYLPAYVVLVGWLVLQFFTNPNTGVAVAAHIGGFAFGVAIGFATRGLSPSPGPAPLPPGPPPDWGFGGRRY